MNFLDITAAAVISIFTVIGIARGFITELFRLIALGGGILSAYLLYPRAREYIDFIGLSPRIETFLSFVMVFIVSASLLFITGWFIKKIIHTAMMGWMDRLLGGLLGMVKGAALITLAGSLFSLIPSKDVSEILNNSKLLSFSQSPPFNLDLKRGVHLYQEIKNKSVLKRFKNLPGPEKVTDRDTSLQGNGLNETLPEKDPKH